jgi:putative thioredoxin
MVIDVSEASFPIDVLERSRDVPVVVDFWAAWCGPCRSLGPLLERAAERRQGDVVLAKVDVDANPRLQAQFEVRGIPAVKAFRDGRVVAEFVGAQPANAVERFFDALVPSAGDRLVAAGSTDEAALRAALEGEPGHTGVRVALGGVLLRSGRAAEAAEVLAPVEHDPAAAGMLAQVQVLGSPETSEQLRAVLQRLQQGDAEWALPALIAAVRVSAGEELDQLRRVAVGTFAELGEEHPLTRQHRPQLAAALY